MKLVADESVDQQIVAALRAAGHEVTYIAEVSAGITDESVLKCSNEARSVLITADKDFGELVYRLQLQHSGVVLIRLPGMSADDKAGTVISAVDAHRDELSGAFTVISKRLVRLRRGSA